MGCQRVLIFSYIRERSTPSAATEMSVAEGGRIFEAITERAIETDMRDQNETRGRERRQDGNESGEREQTLEPQQQAKSALVRGGCGASLPPHGLANN